MPSSMKINRPQPRDFPEFFQRYIDLVPDGNVLKVLEGQVLDFQFIFSDIPIEQENFRYEPGKWSLKEVLGHIIDTERILSYRALSFARGNNAVQPGFDPDGFMANANFNKRTVYDLAHEFGIVRNSNLVMIRNFSEEDFQKRGVANNWEMSVGAIVYAMAGHALHHVSVIKSKYLI
jgi:hypothetical protein